MSQSDDKRSKFAREYVASLNAKQSAIAAGYAPKYAEIEGSRLLRSAQVKDEIAALQRAALEKAGVNAAWLLRRLADIAEAQTSDLFDADGNILPPGEWPEIFQKGGVSGFKVRRDTTRSYNKETGEERISVECEIIDVKLMDRARTLEMIGRHIAVGAWGGGDASIGDQRYTTIRRVIVEEREAVNKSD